MKKIPTSANNLEDRAAHAIENGTVATRKSSLSGELITTHGMPKPLRSVPDNTAHTASSVSFRLDGILPSGKNAVIVTRTGHRFPQKRFTDWRTKALAELHAQCGGSLNPITHRLALIVDYTPGDRRTRDIAGMLDAICHLLERSGLIQNDGLIRDCTWHEFDMDRNRPQTMVTLRRL